jgi:two-component system, NtrC family, sensor kinase
VLESRTIQIEDVETDPQFTFKEALQIGKARTLLGVPLMRQGKPTGVLVLTRSAVEPFNDKQIELVETFADQAVMRTRGCSTNCAGHWNGRLQRPKCFK